MRTRVLWAYIIGVALGDGNLSNPNGRALRLRITCDARYPVLADDIRKTLATLLPDNSVSIVRTPGKDTYFNISVYSNHLSRWIPWKAGHGSKIEQRVRVPAWIRRDSPCAKACLRGLFQTDGSIYQDRGYTMVNFCNVIEPLAKDVHLMLRRLGYRSTLSRTAGLKHQKYTVRVTSDSKRLIKDISLYKA